MKRLSAQTLCFLLLLLAAALPAGAQKAYVDYDGATAFSQIRTFKLVETSEDLSDVSPMMHNTVLSALHEYATAGGLQPVESDPDVYVAYYTADQGHLRLILTDLDYTYGPDFTPGTYWAGGVGTRTPYSYTFKEGTLIIDIWEADTKRLIWRGMATSALSKNPEKNAKKVDKALAKIFKKWEKDYGGYARRLRLYQESQENQPN